MTHQFSTLLKCRCVHCDVLDYPNCVGQSSEKPSNLEKHVEERQPRTIKLIPEIPTNVFLMQQA